MKLRIEVREVKGKDLKPGDLFSRSSTGLWADVNDSQEDPHPVGELVYIRTNHPLSEEMLETKVTLVIVHLDEGTLGESDATVD